MGEVALQPKARDDLDAIWEHIAEDHPENARRFLERLLVKCQLLAASPEIGVARPMLGQDIRMFPVRSYNIYYQTTESGILIVRVLHASRDTVLVAK